MKINVEENLIEPNQRNTITIEKEMQSFLETNEGENIKSDIQLLVQMGFDSKMINKVYILLKPIGIDRAIDYMTEVDGIYQHDFFESTKDKSLCFICKKPKRNHLDYIPDENEHANENDNLIDNQQDIVVREDNDLIQDNNDNNVDCEVCYDELNNEEKKRKFNSLWAFILYSLLV